MYIKKMPPRKKPIKTESSVNSVTSDSPKTFEDPPAFGVSNDEWLKELKDRNPVMYYRLLNWD